MIAIICVGGMTYNIEKVKRIDVSMDGAFCKITDEDGYEYETSPHNVVIINPPKERGDK